MRREVSLAYSLLAVLASLYLLVVPSAQAENGGPVLITQNVDEAKLTTLKGNTRPEAKKQNDRGLVADNLLMEHMLLQLKRSPEQERELQQYLEELQDSSAPNFHHWLTAKEFGERFGLAKPDLDSIKGWLQSHGLTVNVVYENGLLIDFSGTAGQVREAFHTEIHQLDVKGVKHIANMSDPQIPVTLAPAVVGVVSLHDFMPHAMYKPRANYTFTSNGVTSLAVVPADLATIYNLNPLFSTGISGQGQTIVVIEDTNVYSTADWTKFRSVFGLSSYTDGSFTQVHPAPPSGTNNCKNPGINGDDGEAILDAEYSSAAAPSAAIELASCGDTRTTFGGLIALQNLLNESSLPPALVSISYGECEAENGATANAAYNATYQQAASEGVSVFVSSGDEGAASCDANAANATHGIGVSGFTSTPYNVSVGGTDFGDTYAGTDTTYWNATNKATYGSAKSYVPEIPWNDSCASVLIATTEGYSQTYGSTGFCNSILGEAFFLATSSGSGGPSGCATGSPAVSGVVGGTCAGWPKPSWQLLVGNPSDGVRDIPDVSLFAANGIWGHYYPFCWSDIANGGAPCTGAPDNWAGAGGTSFASPIMAGIQALVNQKTGARQGNPNSVYYRLAASEYGASGDPSCNSTLGNAAGSSCIFYDVTQGDMDVNCTGAHNCYRPSGTYGVLSTSTSSYQPAYGATTGWDFATGIGSVNAANLVNNWPAAAAPVVTLSPTSLTWGEVVVGVKAAAQTVTVTNTGTATLNIISITTSGDFAQMKVAKSCGSTLAARASCVILVTFTPTQLGARAGNLTINDSASSSPQTVPLSGTGAPQATLTPASKAFAAENVGKSSPAEVFTLSNQQSVTLDHIVISTTGDFNISTTTCATSLAAKTECAISVVFTPTGTGTRTGTLKVADSADNSPQTSSLTGTGK